MTSEKFIVYTASYSFWPYRALQFQITRAKCFQSAIFSKLVHLSICQLNMSSQESEGAEGKS